jgi:hypothetical protein
MLLMPPYLLHQVQLYIVNDRIDTSGYLTDDAVPSVFHFPPHLVRKQNERKPPMKRSLPITSPSDEKKKTEQKEEKEQTPSSSSSLISAGSPSKEMLKMKIKQLK